MSHKCEVPALSSCWEPLAQGEPLLTEAALPADCPCPATPMEKVEMDHRSIYVGNVSAGGEQDGVPSGGTPGLLPPPGCED